MLALLKTCLDQRLFTEGVYDGTNGEMNIMDPKDTRVSLAGLTSTSLDQKYASIRGRGALVG